MQPLQPQGAYTWYNTCTLQQGLNCCVVGHQATPSHTLPAPLWHVSTFAALPVQPEEAPIVAGIRYMKPEQAAAAGACDQEGSFCGEGASALIELCSNRVC